MNFVYCVCGKFKFLVNAKLIRTQFHMKCIPELEIFPTKNSFLRNKFTAS